MAVSVHFDHDEVFKFYSSGMEALIHETSEHLYAQRERGYIPETIRFENDKRLAMFKFVITYE